MFLVELVAKGALGSRSPSRRPNERLCTLISQPIARHHWCTILLTLGHPNSSEQLGSYLFELCFSYLSSKDKLLHRDHVLACCLEVDLTLSVKHPYDATIGKRSPRITIFCFDSVQRCLLLCLSKMLSLNPDMHIMIDFIRSARYIL